MDKEAKILIVGTQPYNKTVQSRAFDSYFHQFKKTNLAQIFSDARVPCKGHCDELFQITDYRLLKRRVNSKIKTGRLFRYDELLEEWTDLSVKTYKPKNRGPLYRFMRKWIWKKKYWDTLELEEFVANFSPNYIFIAFSKDFFIFDIAIHFAEKYHTKLILSIADDYVFYDAYRGHLFNRLYRKKYLKIIDKVMNMDAFCIFESEKIKKLYLNHYLNVAGEVIYIASNISPKLCEGFDLTKDWYYFGNLEYGRYESILEIAKTLQSFNSTIKIHVYSRDIGKVKDKSQNIILHSPVNYNKMIEISLNDAGALLLVEGFAKKDVKMVEYSLSTKVGDSLSLGKPVIAYGHQNSGAMDFLLEQKCCFLATNKNDLSRLINDIICGLEDKEIYLNQFGTAKKCFSLIEQSQKFFRLFNK